MSARHPPLAAARRARHAAVMRRLRLGLLVVASLALVALVAGPLRAYVFASNLHAVIPSAIYRSAQPSGARLADWIDELSLRTVVNLRGRKSQDDRRWLREEIATAERAGVAHVSIRMSSDDVPPAQTLRELVRVIDTAERPLLLHCKAGAERSALAAAVAVLLETGDLEHARAEFALDKGFVHWLNPRLPRVLDDYAAWLAERGEASTPDRFRAWVTTEYAPYFYRARIEPVGAPAQLAAGTPAELRFRVTNASRQPIPFQSQRHAGVHLGARLAPPGGGDPIELRAGFVDLTLAPGTATELVLPLPALHEPGRYALRVDLVDEGVKWFASLGSTPLDLPLEVAAAP
jgi:protein tyrosine phosphatase (PTP) superfamily phosphohydrolase (DUF442 family)